MCPPQRFAHLVFENVGVDLFTLDQGQSVFELKPLEFEQVTLEFELGELLLVFLTRFQSPLTMDGVPEEKARRHACNGDEDEGIKQAAREDTA